LLKKILETERTILRELDEKDAEFILDLLNQPSFIKYIGDRNVRTVEESRVYIKERMIISYEQFGFGMYLVGLKENKTPIGVCGFVKRDSLPELDIGFAFLADFEGKGYGFESAEAVMKYGKEVLDLNRVLAIATQDNHASHKLLEKLGFEFERLVKMPHDEEELKMFSTDL
jgi:RimJ/RimL family protein N-acetyltransferase